MRQKKNCDRCRAFETRYPYCTLGYLVKPEKALGTIVGGLPQEPCPKPITYKQWGEAEHKYTQK